MHLPSVSAALIGVAVLACAQVSTSLPTNQTGPVIGILSQPDSPEIYRGDAVVATSQAYIAASYVKYLESAGARVVPIHCNMTETELEAKAKMINGFLVPGGGQDLGDMNNPYTRTATYVMNLAKQFNENGDYFPVWGTCLGFQMVSVFIGGISVLESGFDSENLPLPLNFTSNLATSRIFATARPELVQALKTDALTMNNHQAGVTPASFAANHNLSSFFNVISTNVDRKGRPFVSTIEGKTMPFYASQWHPEKNSFEFTPNENIPHSALAIETCQLTANFFVNEARKSNHYYPPNQLNQDIIYNYCPVFTGRSGSGFEQSYYWDM
eukprot:m.165583 g.165583  ORF g.165583 m.165583 type:complete len:327 (+) comp16427_c1_seq2:264-1244(+)